MKNVMETYNHMTIGIAAKPMDAMKEPTGLRRNVNLPNVIGLNVHLATFVI